MRQRQSPSYMIEPVCMCGTVTLCSSFSFLICIAYISRQKITEHRSISEPYSRINTDISPFTSVIGFVRDCRRRPMHSPTVNYRFTHHFGRIFGHSRVFVVASVCISQRHLCGVNKSVCRCSVVFVQSHAAPGTTPSNRYR